MKPIVAQSFDEIEVEDIKKIFQNSNDNETAYYKILNLRQSERLPQYIDADKLGIYYRWDSKGGKYKTSSLVGIMPIYKNICQGDIENGKGWDKNYYWCIKPSWGEPLKMLEKVLESEDISDDKIYRFFEPKVMKREEWSDYCENNKLMGKDSDFLMGIVSDGLEIDIGHNLEKGDKEPQLVSDCLNAFELYDYILQLEKICKRVLKQQSLPIEENLIGKVKGRVVINKQIKHNLSKGRIDRNYCSYNKMSIDTMENRILKYALYMCKQWSLQRTNFMMEKIVYCDHILKDVRLVSIRKSDLCNIKTNVAFKDYKKGIEKAKRIIQKFAFAFKGEAQKDNMEVITKKVKPFFLRIDLLFELYTRALLGEVLRKIEDGKKYYLKGYSENARLLFPDSVVEDKKPVGFQNKLIADILIRNEEKNVCVLDAKYSMLSEGYHSRIRENTHQLLAYMQVFASNSGGFIYPINSDDHTLITLRHKKIKINKNDNNEYELLTEKKSDNASDNASDNTSDNVSDNASDIILVQQDKKIQWVEKEKDKPVKITISDDFKLDINTGEYWISDKIRVNVTNDEKRRELEFVREDLKNENGDGLYCLYAEFGKYDSKGRVYFKKDLLKKEFNESSSVGLSIGLRPAILDKGIDSEVGKIKDFLITLLEGEKGGK